MAANKKKDNNDTVILNLDRVREVKFTHRALKRLCTMLGKPMHEVMADALQDMYDKTEIYVLCGLMKDAEINSELLNLEQVEELMEKTPYHVIIEAIQTAFAKSLGFEENEETKIEEKLDEKGKN